MAGIGCCFLQRGSRRASGASQAARDVSSVSPAGSGRPPGCDDTRVTALTAVTAFLRGGQEPGVCPATAKTHVAHLLARLGARDRVPLVILAYQAGLVTTG